MKEVFEQIARIESVTAAALVTPLNRLLGWCANSAIAPEKLLVVAESCRSMLDSLRAENYETTSGYAAFHDRTLVFRLYPQGLFIIYLNSPINDEVLCWLWAQIDPLLERGE